MRNLAELDSDVDSVNRQILEQRVNHYLYRPTYFTYYLKKDTLIMPDEVYRQKLFRDSVARIPYAERSRKDSLKNKDPQKIARTDSSRAVADRLQKKISSTHP
jgi:lipopolysaccharide export system permease protein